MADKGIILISTITDISDAIREKTGTTGNIPTTEMAAKIRSISGSGSSSFDITNYQVIAAKSTTYTTASNVRTFSFSVNTSPVGIPSATPPTIELLGINWNYSTTNTWTYDYTIKTTGSYQPILQMTIYQHALEFTIATTNTALTEMTVVVIFRTV